jgi:hypothetical protein
MRRIALLLLPAPLALAACGSGGSAAGSKAEPVTHVRHAARKTATTSEHVTMTQKFSGATTTGSGDFSSSPLTGSAVVSDSVSGHTTKFHAIVSGPSVYERETAGPDTGDVAPGKKWVMVDFAKKKGGIVDPAMELARSPMEALQQLEAAGTATEVGTDTIDGVATTHYRISLDLSKLPSRANSAYLIRPKYGAINVWIGSADGYVYRDTVAVTDRGGSGSTLTSSVNFSKFGEAVHVNAPPASETLDIGKYS